MALFFKRRLLTQAAPELIGRTAVGLQRSHWVQVIRKTCLSSRRKETSTLLRRLSLRSNLSPGGPQKGDFTSTGILKVHRVSPGPMSERLVAYAAGILEAILTWECKDDFLGNTQLI